MSKFEMICIEIGSCNRLSHDDAKKAADKWNEARRLNPGAIFTFCLAGYDDDPRAIWETPEAAAYVRTWAELVGLDDLETAQRVFDFADERRVGATLGLLDMCGLFADKPVFTRGEQLN